MCCKDSDFLLNVQANQDKLLPNGTQSSTMRCPTILVSHFG